MRAKFLCDDVSTYKGTDNEIVKLSAVHGGDKNEEDNQFSEATPSGQLQMTISNPAAKGFFETGKKYYLDISEAAE